MVRYWMGAKVSGPSPKCDADSCQRDAALAHRASFMEDPINLPRRGVQSS